MAETTPKANEPTRRSGEPDEVVRHWLAEINAAKKREKDFRKDGQRIIDIYEGKKKDEIPFNILYSNTETMLPTLYSSIPRPVVDRRFKDDDPLGKQSAQAGQRMLEFLLDTNIEGYETVDSALKAATIDALLPGRGVTSLIYEADFGVLPQPEVAATADGQAKPEAGKSGGAPDQPAAKTSGGDEEAKPGEYKKSEIVCANTRSWNRVFFGYAKKWSRVPWVAYEEHIDDAESKRLFGDVVTKKLTFTVNEDVDRSDESEEGKNKADENDTGDRKTCLVYQIWDKDGGRKIRYISPQYNDGFLKVLDDPLELTGFFDCPEPLMFIDKVNDLLPVPLYALYENQAEELNKIQRRINKLVSALRARAIYDSELGSEIEKLMESGDNDMVPADKSSSLAAEKGLQNAIWFFPLEVVAAVLEKLYAARESCKQVIYEINGIADILRGATKASETFGAQKLKSEWGTLRLKPKQKEVQRYAREMLRIMLEIAATKFSEESWAKMTGLPFLLEPKFNELTAVANALKAKVQQDQMAAQVQAAAAQQAGQQPAPPQPSPSSMQLQQVVQQLQAPKWSDVLALLRDDMQRSYRIDIETNSTVEPEAVEDQKNISEVMTALGQFLQGVTPLVVAGTMPFAAAQAMMLAIVRRFRFGPEIEDYIKQMQPPKPQDNGKEAAAQKEQLAKDAKAAQDSTASQAKIAQLETALKAGEEERALIERKAALDVRELKITVAEEALKKNEQASLEKISTKDTVSTIKNSADQRVKATQEQSAKREQQIAKASTDGVGQLHKAITQLAELQTNLLAAIGQQAQATQATMQEVVQAVTATRETEAVLDEKTGRIKKTISRTVKKPDSRAEGVEAA